MKYMLCCKTSSNRKCFAIETLKEHFITEVNVKEKTSETINNCK